MSRDHAADARELLVDLYGSTGPRACRHTADMFPELERVKPQPKRAQLKRPDDDPAQESLFPQEELDP